MDDSQVIYHAVNKDKPPGRQLDKIKTVLVGLLKRAVYEKIKGCRCTLYGKRTK